MLTRETWLAYQQTSYWVHTPAGSFELRIGVISPDWEQLLNVAGHRSWCVLTAVNPQSKQLSNEENAARQAVLERELAAGGVLHWPTEARANGGDWPVEHGWCLPDLPQRIATSFGRAFGQWAVVWGEVGHPPELIWCDDDAAKAAANYSSGKR